MSSSKDDHNALAALSTENTASLLRILILENTSTTIHLGALIKKFESRSFGGLLLILSILALLPVISFLAGVIIIFVGCQMCLGFSVPFLPAFITDQKVNRAVLESYVEKAIPWLDRAHKYIRPRWFILSHAFTQRLIGLLVILLALISLLPLPLSNMPPSISLIVIAIGILEKDGVLMSIGALLSVFALLLGYFIFWFVFHSVSSML